MDIAEQIRAQIRAHPFELVAAAALFGAWLGFAPPRKNGIVLRLAREAMFHQLGVIAKRWLAESKIGAHREPDVGRHDGAGDWLQGRSG